MDLPDEDSNPHPHPSIHELSHPTRRTLLQGSLGAALAGLLQGCDTLMSPGLAPATGSLGFQGIAPSLDDSVRVPAGYTAAVIVPWGDPVGIPGAMPAWRDDAGNSAAEQAQQMGMHHDGMQFFALAGTPDRGLLVMNHEYTDDGLLHPDGMQTWSAEKVRKAQAAHGISVVELRRAPSGEWSPVRPSPYARRITAQTPLALQGPAAGHPLVQTAADPAGRRVLGTFANCAAGRTPWGTYLSGEENFAFYFDGDPANPHHRRWGLPRQGYFRWGEHDERFDATRHPNEPNRFGWIVEVDPQDPTSTPIKRTALGRAAHEGAWVATTRDGRAVVYSGEDARFECIYKFVSRDRIAPGGAAANRELLDHGTLYVARFLPDGQGEWLPLVHGRGPLTAANGFADQGEVLIKARQASDALGATKMDRPEWLAIHPQNGEVFCSLTNNSLRGAPGQPGVDAANPRANNTMGQIIAWREGGGAAQGGDFDAITFRWRHLLLAGDPANARPEARGNVQGDAFGCPDGLCFSPNGLLWIQTDVHASQLPQQAGPQGEFTRIGNNQMLACDTRTGEVRRFLTGPINAEITGATFTPDGRTLFVNIQHPGEPPGDRSDPQAPTRYSRWPGASARPRSATVVIRRLDGEPIGA